MAEQTTVARPYAQAVFQRAVETNRLPDWTDTLQFIAAVAADDSMRQLIESARFTKSELAQLFIDVCGDRIDIEGANLVRVLAENGRLELLPEIAAVYEVLRAEAESTIDAEMISAYPVSDEQRDQVARALSTNLGRKVNLHTSTDAGLLGGAIIRAGDMVIDGSLATAMNQ
ncbi:MAG: F0F1 ATP synthase subunit delta [Gammaproteobacteria bacterium]